MKRAFIFAIFVTFLIGCSGNGSTPIINTPVVPSQHLYVENFFNGQTGQIYQYPLPLTSAAAAMPNFGFLGPGEIALALDLSGNLAANDTNGKVTFYPAPLSSASVSTAAFGSGPSGGQLVFTPAGDLFKASRTDKVFAYTHPFTNASVPSTSISAAGLTIAGGVGLDAAANLYVSNASSANIYVFAPPYTGAPISTAVQAGKSYGYLAVSTTQLFVLDRSGATGSVDVFNLPLTTASVPAFTITSGIGLLPQGIALDNAGNLYIGAFQGVITEYSAPYSAASAPVVTVPAPSNFEISGAMAIGK